MPFHGKLGFSAMLGAVLAFGLAACEREYWPQGTWVTIAAQNSYEKLPDGTRQYKQPMNTWVDNPQLAKALREEIAESSLDRVLYRYEFECKPQQAGGSCDDCRTCTATFWQSELSTTSFMHPGFKHRGDALVSAQFGPGKAVSAMTYWTNLSMR